MVGAENDVLAKYARRAILDVAGVDKSGREEGKIGFEIKTYKWTLVKDVRHGFGHGPMDHQGLEAEAMRKKRANDTVERVGGCLFDGCFAQSQKLVALAV